LLPLALFIYIPYAKADGETRPATSGEKQFYTRVMSTFAKALPPGPEGWTQHHTSSLIAPETIRIGAEKGPLYQAFFINWKDTGRIDAHQTQFDQALRNHSGQKPDPKAQAVLVKAYDDLSKKLEAVFQKGDKSEIQRLQKEMGVVAEKMKNLSAPAMQALVNTIPKMPLDVEVNIQVIANVFSKSLRSSAIAESSIGGVMIYRDNTLRSGADGQKDGETYAFIGKWEKVSQKNGIEMTSAPNPKLAYTDVQTILVVIGADGNRAHAILEKINWAVLKAFIQH
jgi:hypothetical protein